MLISNTADNAINHMALTDVHELYVSVDTFERQVMMIEGLEEQPRLCMRDDRDKLFCLPYPYLVPIELLYGKAHYAKELKFPYESFHSDIHTLHGVLENRTAFYLDKTYPYLTKAELDYFQKHDHIVVNLKNGAIVGGSKGFIENALFSIVPILLDPYIKEGNMVMHNDNEAERSLFFSAGMNMMNCYDIAFQADGHEEMTYLALHTMEPERTIDLIKERLQAGVKVIPVF